MDTLSIEQARRQLGEVVDRARLMEQPTRITRQGKPAAVVVSPWWYAAVIDYISSTGNAFAEWRQLRDSFHGGEVRHRDGDPANNDPANLEIREKQ